MACKFLSSFSSLFYFCLKLSQGSEDKSKEPVVSPNKDAPSGSSRRKQGKVTAQRGSTGDAAASKGNDDDDDDDIVEIVSGPR